MLARAANFDRLARLYAPLERLSFGGALTRRRMCFLGDPGLAAARRALVLGDGDGRFTAALLARYRGLEVTAVDVSASMLDELARRVARHTPQAALVLHRADMRTWLPPAGGYDLVVTHFFFDCFSTGDVATMVLRVSAALAPDARWLVSDFAIPRHGARALAATLLVRALYFAFWALTGLDVTRLPDYESALKSAGFRRTAEEAALGGALRSELWERGAALDGTRARGVRDAEGFDGPCAGT